MIVVTHLWLTVWPERRANERCCAENCWNCVFFFSTRWFDCRANSLTYVIIFENFFFHNLSIKTRVRLIYECGLYTSVYGSLQHLLSKSVLHQIDNTRLGLVIVNLIQHSHSCCKHYQPHIFNFRCYNHSYANFSLLCKDYLLFACDVILAYKEKRTRKISERITQ